MILLNQINSAILQLLLFLSVPFMWYVVTHKKIKWFFCVAGNQSSTKTAFESYALYSNRIFSCSFSAIYVALPI